MFSDPIAVEKFKELVKEYGVKTVVETGTYKGDSTVGIAELVPYTVSIEVVREHFESSRARFISLGYQLVDSTDFKALLQKGSSKVALFCGNSADVIKGLVELLEEPILFFLDAHWLEYWPLKDEIRAIKPRPNSLIIVHDIRVPGKDFGYDTYIPGTAVPIDPRYQNLGTALDYDYIKDDLAFVNPNYRIFYNEKAGGHYRGILYAVPRTGKETKPMKLLVVSTKIFPVSGELRYGGIERLVYLIATGLKAQGHQVSVAAPEGSLFPQGIEHINTGPLGDFVESERVALGTYNHRLKEFDAILDLSHTHWAMIENDLPGLAFIWHDPYIMKPLEPTYNICALSEWQRNRFRQVYGYDIGWSTPLARVVDPHCGYPLLSKADSGRFLFIGKMGPQKGALESIEICRELKVPLDIIGAPSVGDPPEYLEQVKARCGGDIVYLGGVDDNTKNDMLARARALIYPINYPPGQGEAHSHKIVDTLLASCPVVTYNTGAFSEIIEHGVTGYLVDTKEHFKQAMLQARHLDRARIREIAAKRWSVEATTKRIVAVAQRVAEGERWGQARSVGPVIIRPQAPSAVGYVKYSERAFPRQIRLDTINACNAQCIPCHLNFQTRPKGQMSMEMINRILDDIISWPLEEIVPVGFGEFFLRKDWYDILRLIEQKLPQTRIALPTNGSLLDDKAMEKLMLVRTLKWVNFSVNAFFSETYEAFTGLKAETIDRVKRAIGKLKAFRPDITTCASMIFDTTFQSEMERDLFIQFWQPLASTVSINPANYCNSPLKSPAIPTRLACRSVFDGLTVLYDGKVVTNCCWDSNGELEVGNITSQTRHLSDHGESLMEIWRGEKLKRLWNLHNEGRRGEIGLCSKCSFA